jgi:hypothetical protein
MNMRKVNSLPLRHFPPFSSLLSFMKLRHRYSIFLFLALLVFFVPPILHGAEMCNGAPAKAPAELSPADAAPSVLPQPEEGAKKQAANSQTEETNELQTLKQRYNKDSTGVRARLGMCRKEQGGHGGHHRRYRGGERWNSH